MVAPNTPLQKIYFQQKRNFLAAELNKKKEKVIFVGNFPLF